MNSKLYGPRAQVTHISGESAQWRRGFPPASTAIPVGVRRARRRRSRAGRSRAGPDHAEFPAAFDQLTERVAVAEESAAVVKRDLGGVVGDATTGAEARRRCGCGGSSRARTAGRSGWGRLRPG